MFKGKSIIFLILVFFISAVDSTFVFATDDTTGPTLTAMKVSPSELHPGDTLKVELEFRDDESGLAPIAQIAFYHPISHQSLYIYLDYNSVSSKYEGQLQVANNTTSGVWRLGYISIYDNDINHTYITEENSDWRASFNVIGGFQDVTPPTPTALRASPSELKPGDTLKVELEARDDESGLAPISYVRFEHSTASKWLYVTLTYNTSLEKYQGELKLSGDTASGTWQFDCIDLYDNAGNYNGAGSVNSDLRASFKVIGGVEDTTAPILTAMKISPSDLQPGDALKVELEAEDDESGMAQLAYITFMHPATTSFLNLTLEYNSNNGKYEGELKLPNGTKSGRWEFLCLSLSDYAGNEKSINSENTDWKASFNVKPVFLGTDNAVIMKGTDFDALSGVQAVSNFEGNMTGIITYKGSVDKDREGMYLIKYEAVGKEDYVYRDYRWITVMEDTAARDTSRGEVFFNNPVYIGLPSASQSGIGLSKNGMSISMDRTNVVSSEGNYSISLNTSAALLNSVKEAIRGFNSRENYAELSASSGSVKFTIDMTSPTITGPVNNGCYKTSIKPLVKDTNLKSITITKDAKPFKWANGTSLTALGKYILKSVDKAGNSTTIAFTLKDGVSPVISGAVSKTISFGSEFNAKAGVKATDNVDGDLASKLQIVGSVNTKKLGTYKLTYKVSDKSGNTKTILRTITVKDMTKPVITGAKNLKLKRGRYFNPKSGVKAWDNVDKDLTSKIKITGKVNNKKRGTYKLIYKVSDKSGNSAAVTRIITIK
jgi:hypothetical protein